jgi:hypothetical protein
MQFVGTRARIAVPGHEVGEDRHAEAGLAEQGLEHVGGVVVGLEALVPGAGRDAKAASLLRIEHRRKHARRVETRHAQPVDRAVHAHEGEGEAVTDDGVLIRRERCLLGRHRPRNATRCGVEIQRR